MDNAAERHDRPAYPREAQHYPPPVHKSYKNNIAGFGIGVRYIEDAEETPEMAEEICTGREIIELLNIEQDTKEVFEDVVEARETYGIAYLEVGA